MIKFKNYIYIYTYDKTKCKWCRLPHSRYMDSPKSNTPGARWGYALTTLELGQLLVHPIANIDIMAYACMATLGNFHSEYFVATKSKDLSESIEGSMRFNFPTWNEGWRIYPTWTSFLACLLLYIESEADSWECFTLIIYENNDVDFNCPIIKSDSDPYACHAALPYLVFAFSCLAFALPCLCLPPALTPVILHFCFCCLHSF